MRPTSNYPFLTVMGRSRTLSYRRPYNQIYIRPPLDRRAFIKVLAAIRPTE